jgi:hypothetical protein
MGRGRGRRRSRPPWPAAHLRRVRDVAQGLVGRGHRQHLRHTRVEDLHVRDLDSGAAEQQDAEQRDGRVDAALDQQGKEGEGELLTAVVFLVDVLLQHGEVREGEENTRAREDELDRISEDGHRRHVRTRRSVPLGAERRNPVLFFSVLLFWFLSHKCREIRVKKKKKKKTCQKRRH